MRFSSHVVLPTDHMLFHCGLAGGICIDLHYWVLVLLDSRAICDGLLQGEAFFFPLRLKVLFFNKDWSSQ